MKRAFTRAAMTAGALLVLLFAAEWSTYGSWAPGMLVMAPSPEGMPARRPDDVHVALEVAREDARVRVWVFEPAAAPRGTVVLLHGIRDSKQRLADGARRHVTRGYRAV